MKRHCSKFLVVALIAMVATFTPGAEAKQGLACSDETLGHWFYCRVPEPVEEEPETDEESAGSTGMDDALLEEARSFQQRLEDLRLLAAYAPNASRVAEYQTLQMQATDGAARFADYWRRNLWSDASLDYTADRPITQYGRREWLDVREEEMLETLASMSDRYGLFYFYRSDCPYCHRFNPVIADFSSRFDVTVHAVSVDGGPNDYFPDARPNQGQFQQLLEGRQAVVPAVLLLDTETNTPHWVSFGLTSGQELANRIFVTLSRDVGEDF